MHQQNQANLYSLDSLDRAGQWSIEPQKLQKGAVLYSSAQHPAKSVQLCAGLRLSVGLCAEQPKTEIDGNVDKMGFWGAHRVAIIYSYTVRKG